MKIFDFGKKKDGSVDEYLMRGDLGDFSKGDTEHITNGKEEFGDAVDEGDKGDVDEIEDYISLEDLGCDDYEDIVDVIENNGWNVVFMAAFPITTLDTQIVSKKAVGAHSHDVVLEIVCPKERIIAICGLRECNIDVGDFYNKPNLYNIPHFITIMCRNNDGAELSKTTLVSIIKCTKDGEVELYYQEFYGDLSPIVNGKLKRKEERYHLVETIVLQGGEKLLFKIRDPDIDISNIDLLMLSDLFEKTKNEDSEQTTEDY